MEKWFKITAHKIQTEVFATGHSASHVGDWFHFNYHNMTHSCPGKLHIQELDADQISYYKGLGKRFQPSYGH